jgi:hypothetical protein
VVGAFLAAGVAVLLARRLAERVPTPMAYTASG